MWIALVLTTQRNFGTAQLRMTPILFLLFHTVTVLCVESEVSHIKDHRGLAGVTDSSVSPKSYLEPHSPKSEALSDGCELNAGICCDSREHAGGGMMTDFRAIATNPTPQNIKFEHFQDPSSPHTTHNEQNLGTACPKAKLRADATPFVPRPHSLVTYYHAPTNMRLSVSSELPYGAGLTATLSEQKAAFYSPYFPHFNHQTRVMALESTQQNSRERNWVTKLELPTQVIAGFPRAQELQDWFRMVGLSSHLSKNCRRQLVQRVAWAENAYKRTPSNFGSDEDPTVLGQKKQAEFAILKAYEFGHLVLKTFTAPIYMLKSLFEILNVQLTRLKVSEEDHIQKFFFWPIILAGAREWALREAAVFSSYLKCCRPTTSKIDAIELFVASVEELDTMSHKEVSHHQIQEMKILANILGENQLFGERDKWMGDYKNMIKEESFSVLNSRIEEVVCHYFQDEVKQYDGEKLYIDQSKMESFGSKWGLDRDRLFTLVKYCSNSRRTRGMYTMNFEMSKASLSFFENRLLEMVKGILEKRYGTNKKNSDFMVSQFLIETYGEVKRYKKYLDQKGTYELNQGV